LYSNDPNDIEGIISPQLRKQNIYDVVSYTKEAIRNFLSGNVDVGDLIMTKGLWLGTEAENYKVKQAHIELIERIRKREPYKEFQSGQRFSFLFFFFFFPS